MNSPGSKADTIVAIIYFCEMAVAILLAVVLIAISTTEINEALPLFAGGVVVWTLGEYVVHRFVLHNLIQTGHRLHHARPNAPVLAVLWQIWGCFALVYFIAGSDFLSGGLVAYAWHLFVHHSAHHSPGNVPAPLLKHHSNHHSFASRNYGVSTTVWDRVFRTRLR
jgi:sterol desaturase/sphingolipid hydroxylase (fatty acid hydroxylase superfamily)